MASKKGMSIRFKESDVRAMGRTSMGVIGMNIDADDEVIGMQVHNEAEALLFVTENGMGKRTLVSEFNVQNRGGKGVKCYNLTEKTGQLLGFKSVDDDSEVMMITTEGIIIQIRVNDISVLKRITSGVKLINLDDNVKVAQLALVQREFPTEEFVEEVETETTEETEIES